MKHSHVLGNEFRKLGDSAIAATGWLNLAEDSDPTDQTAGRFPSDNVIEANHVHNIGIYGKQVACYHQTIACHNVLRGNVCYDGPRAAINFNDGMGGGTLSKVISSSTWCGRRTITARSTAGVAFPSTRSAALWPRKKAHSLR